LKVCIDPGHGGYDPGAVGNGLKEKDITLEIAMQLRSMLLFNGIEVVMTRDGDYAPGHVENDQNGELWARVKIAKEAKADLFVSVHINAGGGTGVEVLVIGTGGRAETVAEKVLPYLVQAGGWANRGVKTQNVMVLRETSMPAILTENGFIDKVTDAAKLKGPNFFQTLAVAHAKGICDYFGVKYKELAVVTPASNVMHRVILDGKQTMALSSQDAAIAEVKRQVDTGQAQKGSVQRNTDGASVFEYAKTQIPTPVPTMPKTPIMGTETITVEQCRQFLDKHNSNAPDIIPYYKKHGEVLGIRWGYAVAQMIKETGHLTFGGDVKPEQNNFAGIGAVGGGAVGATFLTPEAGVIAQLQHLFAYASTGDLGDYAQIDPRFNLVNRGSCPNWEDLNGRWAVPGVGYGEGIVQIYGQMTKEVIEVPAVSESGAVSLLRKILALLLNFFKDEK